MKEEPIEAHMGRLKINDDSNDEVALLEKSIKLATAEKEALDAAAVVGCSHRPTVPAHDRFFIKDFVYTFADGYISLLTRKQNWEREYAQLMKLSNRNITKCGKILQS